MAEGKWPMGTGTVPELAAGTATLLSVLELAATFFSRLIPRSSFPLQDDGAALCSCEFAVGITQKRNTRQLSLTLDPGFHMNEADL